MCMCTCTSCTNDNITTYHCLFCMQLHLLTLLHDLSSLQCASLHCSVLQIFMAFLTACIPCIEVFQEAMFLMCNNVKYSCGTPCINCTSIRVISIHEVIFSLVFQFSLSMIYSSSFLTIGICVHFQSMLMFCSTVRGGKEGEFN